MGEGGLNVIIGQVVIVAVLLLSVYLAWVYSRGRGGGVPLYAVALVVPATLLAGSVAQLLGFAGVAEAFTVMAIGLSLAALTSGQGMWQGQLRADLVRMRLYQRFTPNDVTDWRAFLKLVDRGGATTATFAYVALDAIAIGASVASSISIAPTELGFALLGMLAPAIFALASATWIYRGIKSLVPGA